MKIPRQVLDAVGQCIYCKATSQPLQTEHIVPFGLNGPWELPRASCQECAKIISEFEREVLRNSLIVPRVALNFPTRNKKQRPQAFSLIVEKEGKETTLQVPIQEHLAAMILLQYKLPAYIDRRQYKSGIEVVGLVNIKVGGPPIEELARKHGAEKLAVSVTYSGDAFPRLLAKIAYGFAVTGLGLNMIETAYVLPAILGKADDIGRWVGCADKTRLPGNDLHEVEALVINNEIRVHVRLFAAYKAPEYLVVVGRVPESFGLRNTNLQSRSDVSERVI